MIASVQGDSREWGFHAFPVPAAGSRGRYRESKTATWTVLIAQEHVTTVQLASNQLEATTYLEIIDSGSRIAVFSCVK